MPWGRVILGGVMVAIGLVWLLQGVRVLPGSFMTGSAFWAVAGAVVAVVGVIAIAGAFRGRAR